MQAPNIYNRVNKSVSKGIRSLDIMLFSPFLYKLICVRIAGGRRPSDVR